MSKDFVSFPHKYQHMYLKNHVFIVANGMKLIPIIAE